MLSHIHTSLSFPDDAVMTVRQKPKGAFVQIDGLPVAVHPLYLLFHDVPFAWVPHAAPFLTDGTCMFLHLSHIIISPPAWTRMLSDI